MVKLRKTHYYRAFGLNIHSDICLPELVPDISQSQADVHIRYGQGLENISSHASAGQNFIVKDDQVILRGDGFDLAVAGGENLTIHCDNPALHQEPIRLRILGAGIGLLLQQRGQLVLHGATIVGQHGAAVVMGNSGDGKSTLTMQLAQRGYRLSGDDKCVARIDEHDIFAVPCSPFIKVSKKLVAQMDVERSQIHFNSALENKVYVDLGPRFELGDVPIIAGFVLGRAARTSVKKLTQRQAFDNFLEHNYRKTKFFKTGLQKTQFLHCHNMANSVPVYQYFRPLTDGHLHQPEPEFLDVLGGIIGNGR